MGKHKIVSLCAECGERWPCSTRFEELDEKEPRCIQINPSGRRCINKISIGNYCRIHSDVYLSEIGALDG